MSALPKRKYLLDEYLELDARSEGRLEYWDGEIYDMSGVDPEHDQIESNLNLRFRLKLEGKPCRMFLANTRIKVPSLPPYRYGDSSGLCGEPQFEMIGVVRVLTNPALIIEILSHSTEAFDRGTKFTHYKSIPSFCEYLLIAQLQPHVTHLVKQADGAWVHQDYKDLDDAVRLFSLGCELNLREIYENVTFDESAINSYLRLIEGTDRILG